MTAFAINSGGVEYFDQKTGGSVNATLDTYTISNESTLVVRTDTYACPNHSSAFGSLDNVAWSGLGGKLIFDPTYVRHVAYTGGTGNSPAFGAAISQGGVSGVFLGVWADWQNEPVAPGVAIPSSGFIKIGGVIGGSFSAGSLTGIAATCSGSDVQSWIEVRGADTATIAPIRTGSVECDIAWLYLDETNGSAGQVISCPTTGSLSAVFPGCFIESAPGSGVYERYVGVGSTPALAGVVTDKRCQFVWHTSAGLRLGSDGTNTVGYLPPAGCKVRIPAVILTCCTRSGSGSGARVVPSSTLATRMEFFTNASGSIDLNGVIGFWYFNFQAPLLLKIANSIISTILQIANNALPFDVSNTIVGVSASVSTSPLSLTSCLFGGKIESCDFARYRLEAGNAYCISLQNCIAVEMSDVKAIASVRRVSTILINLANVNNSTLTDVTCVGGAIMLSGCTNVDVLDTIYADDVSPTATSVATNAVATTASTSNVRVSGLSFFSESAQCYGNVFSVSASNNIIFENVGSFDLRLDLGATNGASGVLGLSGAARNIKMRRVYVANTRSSPFDFFNTARDVVLENVFVDYADTSPIAANNTLVKGCGFTSSTTGQTAVYGSHWKDRFTSGVVGAIEITANEPSEQTSVQCQITSGIPKFNSSGSVLMTVVGQQIIWEMPYFAIGHTALANSALALTGTNTGNLSYEFQYDLGAGYNGTWLTANAANFTDVGAIDPAIGIKIKLRITCVTANASNALTNIRITTVTTSTAQSENLYPLDTVTLTLTGLVSGSDVVVRAAGTGTILASVDSNAGTTWAYVYETPVAIDVDIFKPGYVPKPLLRNYTPSAQDSSLPVSQLLDRNYI